MFLPDVATKKEIQCVLPPLGKDRRGNGNDRFSVTPSQ